MTKKQWYFNEDGGVSARGHPEVESSPEMLFETMKIGDEIFYPFALEKANEAWLIVEEFKEFYEEAFETFDGRWSKRWLFDKNVLRRTMEEVENPGGYRAAMDYENRPYRWVVTKQRSYTPRSYDQWTVSDGHLQARGLSIPLRDLGRSIEVGGRPLYAWPLVVAGKGDYNMDVFKHAFEAAVEKEREQFRDKNGEISYLKIVYTFMQAKHPDGHRVEHIGENHFEAIEGTYRI